MSELNDKYGSKVFISSVNIAKARLEELFSKLHLRVNFRLFSCDEAVVLSDSGVGFGVVPLTRL